MRKVPIEKLHAGMILAKPFHDIQGKVLLMRGCKLTVKTIARLEDWDCEFLYIEGSPLTSDEKTKTIGIEYDVSKLDLIFDDFDKRFEKVSQDEVLMTIKETLKRFIEFKCVQNEN